ncbi:MAG: PTS sugar transporter subunit IIC [Candidatus Schekmanbacteria bacterium]|nr:PTS sugar transporter subunit IIC [Candidatus Schekmanbacteria bacterium]
MINEIIVAVILGSIIALDRTAVLQLMISQPIVASPIIGYFLGNPILGLHVGAATQLIWLPSLQIGAAIVPNASVAAILITSASIIIMQFPEMSGITSMSICGAVFLCVIPLLSIEEKADMLVRKNNYIWVEAAIKAIKRDDLSLIGVYNLGGILFFFLKNMVFLAVSLSFLILLLPNILTHLPKEIISSFSHLFRLLPVIGVAVILKNLLIKKFYYYFIAGACVQIIIILLMLRYG